MQTLSELVYRHRYNLQLPLIPLIFPHGVLQLPAIRRQLVICRNSLVPNNLSWI